MEKPGGRNALRLSEGGWGLFSPTFTIGTATEGGLLLRLENADFRGLGSALGHGEIEPICLRGKH
jgi:hypothetical protein